MIRKGIAARFTLGKQERLKSRKLIADLFSAGKTFNAYPLKALYKFTDNPLTLQAGFTASSRTFKKAVDRNRIKRLMREAYRIQKNDLRDLLTTKAKSVTIFFIYTGKEIADFETFSKKIATVLNVISKEVQNP